MRWVLVLVLLAGCKVSGADWRREMERELPDRFCEPKQYFRQCFDVDEATCRKTVTDAMGPCITSVHLPDEIPTSEGGKYGEKIGQCVGGAYDDKLATKRNANPKCLDAKNWE